MGTIFSQDGSLQLQRNRAEYCVENIALGSIYSGLGISSAFLKYSPQVQWYYTGATIDSSHSFQTKELTK